MKESGLRGGGRNRQRPDDVQLSSPKKEHGLHLMYKESSFERLLWLMCGKRTERKERYKLDNQSRVYYIEWARSDGDCE